jgi:anti-sigma factor (TIGR02949 family)
MNCQEALDLLYDIIDKEANDIDAGEVQQHLDGCRDCFKIYHLENSLQDLITERLKDDGSNGNLENLKSRVVLQLDTIDKETAPGAPPRSHGLIAKTMVAVASVVILIGAVSLASDYYQHVYLYEPFEISHHQVLEQANTQPEIAPDASYLGLDFSDIGQTAGFSLNSSTTRDFGGVPMTHLVFRNGERAVSVFAAPSSQYEIPSGLSNDAITHEGTMFFPHRCHDCNLLFHKIGSAVIIAVSEHADIDLFSFVPAEEVVLTKLLLH